MPRYCAVKVCRNRGGSTSEHNSKKISFYPFPLRDRSRLKKWVNHMGRDDWSPSRHQYLCSEHFTGDCFDIRWGIRYLKNTSIPTIFPAREDCENKVSIKRNVESSEILPPLCRKPLILRGTCSLMQPSTGNEITEKPQHNEVKFKLPLMANPSSICHSNLPETHTALCEMSQSAETCFKEQTGSIVAVYYGETLCPFYTVEAAVDASSFETAKVENNELMDEAKPSKEENMAVCEHSYCRPNTDRDELWRKVLGLHAKILELDRREESTMAKIHTLETEMALLKRDSATFIEKQKVLEDFITAVWL